MTKTFTFAVILEGERGMAPPRALCGGQDAYWYLFGALPTSPRTHDVSCLAGELQPHPTPERLGAAFASGACAFYSLVGTHAKAIITAHASAT